MTRKNSLLKTPKYLTDLQFPVAKEGLTEDQLYSKRNAKPISGFRGSEESQLLPLEIDGLIL